MALAPHPPTSSATGLAFLPAAAASASAIARLRLAPAASSAGIAMPLPGGGIVRLSLPSAFVERVAAFPTASFTLPSISAFAAFASFLLLFFSLSAAIRAATASLNASTTLSSVGLTGMVSEGPQEERPTSSLTT